MRYNKVMNVWHCLPQITQLLLLGVKDVLDRGPSFYFLCVLGEFVS